MSTISTTALFTTLRARILDYTDATFTTALSGILSDLYHVTAPDNASGAYGVLAIKSPQLPVGGESIRLTGSIELMLFGRPRSAQVTIEAYGDQAAAALATWRDGSSGLAYATDAVSEPLPAFKAPADRELVQVRVTATLKCYPVFLTRLSS